MSTTTENQTGQPTIRRLTKMHKTILVPVFAVMVAVIVAGGVGTYSNISSAYGSGTATGVLAAGEGATAVLALVLLILTLLGQSSPAIIRIGLWAMPAAAAVIAATAARQDVGQAFAFALTPMAITAGAEGLAFVARRVVVHQEGRDAEAQARATAVIRELAYQQARAQSHPSKRVRKASVRRAWRLARKVGHGDAELGTQLLDVQRTRLVSGADAALARMYTPGADTLPALPAVVPAIEAPADAEAMTSRRHDVVTPQDNDGHETGNTNTQVNGNKMPALARAMSAEWADNWETYKPAAASATGSRATGPDTSATGSPAPGTIAGAVRAALDKGLKDPEEIEGAVPELLGREPKADSVRREIRRQLSAQEAQKEGESGTGHYL